MKMKSLFGLVAALTVTGFAVSAQAGWSVNVSLGLPAFFPPPVVVAAPPCPPPVYCPPVVIRPAPVFVCPPVLVPRRPAPYVAPRYGYYGYYGYGHGPRGWGNNDHGYQGGGHR